MASISPYTPPPSVTADEKLHFTGAAARDTLIAGTGSGATFVPRVDLPPSIPQGAVRPLPTGLPPGYPFHTLGVAGISVVEGVDGLNIADAYPQDGSGPLTGWHFADGSGVAWTFAGGDGGDIVQLANAVATPGNRGNNKSGYRFVIPNAASAQGTFVIATFQLPAYVGPAPAGFTDLHPVGVTLGPMTSSVSLLTQSNGNNGNGAVSQAPHGTQSVTDPDFFTPVTVQLALASHRSGLQEWSITGFGNACDQTGNYPPAQGYTYDPSGVVEVDFQHYAGVNNPAAYDASAMGLVSISAGLIGTKQWV